MVASNVPDETELAVIGAGSGGYVTAIRAGHLGLDVTLIEADAIGGVCLNYGCIPSKALIHAANVAHEAGHAEEMGIYADPEVRAAEMTAWKDGVVDQLTDGVETLCERNGATIVEGRAEFVDEHTLQIEPVDGGETASLAFDQAVVATGSRPIEIPGFAFDGEHVRSSRDVLDMETVPDSVLVVGAGYIGMELSTVLAKLGADVQVVEMLDDVLPGYGRRLVRPVKRRARDLGIDVAFGEAAADWRAEGDGVVVTTETEDGSQSTYEAETAVVAVGREPVTDTVGLDAIGLEPNDAGFLETDERARTDLDHVFAVGDVAGEPMLAHKASAEGIVAAEVAAGEPSTLDHEAVPAAVFTDPEIATVGLTEGEAAEAGADPQVGTFRFGANGRALTTGHAAGMVRVVADETGVILGAQIVGPEASELIAELGLAVEMGATLEDVADTIHTHPTLSEAVMEAAEHALGRAIHTANR